MYRIQAPGWVFYAEVVRNTANRRCIVEVSSPDIDEYIVVCVYKDRTEATLQSHFHETFRSENLLMSNSKEVCFGEKHTNTVFLNTEGEDRVRTLTNAAFCFIHRHFKQVQRITVEDANTVKCAGVPYFVGTMSFLLRGKTWYEDCFGAVLEDAAEAAAYRDLQHRFLTPTEVKVPFKTVWERLLNTSNLPKKTVKYLYTSAATYRDFFNELLVRFGRFPFHSMAATCGSFEPFGTTITSLFFMKWTMTVSAVVAAIPKDTYHITPVKLEEPNLRSIFLSPEMLSERQAYGHGNMYLGDDFD